MPGVSFQSRLEGVGQAEATSIRDFPGLAPRAFFCSSVSADPRVASQAPGLGHPEQSLTEMGRARAVCSQYDSPEGVVRSLQVCSYSIEPTVPDGACNLLTKDCVRATLADETEEGGP